jgi:hypothetical protein
MDVCVRVILPVKIPLPEKTGSAISNPILFETEGLYLF